MGVVYAAEHVALNRQVALKFLRGHLADDPVILRRFQREARAASNIAHSGIVDVTDFGDDPDHGVFYIAEYVDGPSLSDHLKLRGALPEREAYYLGAKIADALHAAHSNGITHRDLKPDNIILLERQDRPPQPKILDFGIAGVAREDAEGSSKLTRTGAVFGTPAYMSPEPQCHDRCYLGSQ